jgi:hypothetical protein
VLCKSSSLRLEDHDLINRIVVEPDQDAARGPDEFHPAAAPLHLPGIAIDFADAIRRHAELYTASGDAFEAFLETKFHRLTFIVHQAIENQARQKGNEWARFHAEAGKTYYFKWTSGMMATMIKVTPVDPSVGAKAIRKLHLSKPVEDKETPSIAELQPPFIAPLQRDEGG